MLCASLSRDVASEGYSSLRCAGFSLWWLFLLWSTHSKVLRLQHLRLRGSSVVATGPLSMGLSSCDPWAAALQHVGSSWTRDGTLALAGVFLSTVPPGKLMMAFKYMKNPQENSTKETQSTVTSCHFFDLAW